MKLSILKESVLLLIALLPLFVLFIFWDQLPEEVATHYNFYGEADDWTAKSKLPYMLGGFGLFIYGVLLVVPFIDPKKKFDLMGNKYYYIRLIIMLLLGGTFTMTIVSELNADIELTTYLPQMLFLFFALFGNYLQSIKPNYFVGIRTPWTLENEQVWTKTHRLGGRLWMFGGMLFFLLSLLLKPAHQHIFLIAGILILVLIPTIYSYVLYRKLDTKP